MAYHQSYETRTLNQLDQWAFQSFQFILTRPGTCCQ